MLHLLLIAAIHFSGPRGNQTLAIDDYAVSFPARNELIAQLSLSEADAKRLSDFLRANTGASIAIKIGGQTTLLPAVREIPTGRDIELSFTDRETYERVRGAFGAEADPR